MGHSRTPEQWRMNGLHGRGVVTFALFVISALHLTASSDSQENCSSHNVSFVATEQQSERRIVPDIGMRPILILNARTFYVPLKATCNVEILTMSVHIQPGKCAGILKFRGKVLSKSVINKFGIFNVSLSNDTRSGAMRNWTLELLMLNFGPSDCILEGNSGSKQGLSFLARDIDECQNQSACPNGAVCSNTFGSYECNPSADTKVYYNSTAATQLTGLALGNGRVHVRRSCLRICGVHLASGGGRKCDWTWDNNTSELNCSLQVSGIDSKACGPSSDEVFPVKVVVGITIGSFISGVALSGVLFILLVKKSSILTTAKDTRHATCAISLDNAQIARKEIRLSSNDAYGLDAGQDSKLQYEEIVPLEHNYSVLEL